MTSRIAPSRMVWSIASLALLARAIVLWLNLGSASPVFTNPDSESYIQAGASLARQFSFVGADGLAMWCRPPGYPAMLALTFAAGIAAPDRLVGAVFIQLLLSSAVVVLGTRLAFLFGGAWRAGAVGLLLAFEPSSIAYSNLVLSETLYSFILIAAMLACWSWLDRPDTSRLVGFALLLSALPLVRPVALHLPWILCMLVLWRAPVATRVRHAVLFLALALLPSAAWTARNWVHFGSATFDQTGPLAKAMFAHQVELRAGVPDDRFGPDAPWYQLADGAVLPAREAMARQEEFFTGTLRAHPAEAAKEVLYTGAVLIGVPDSYLPVIVTGHPNVFEGGSVAGRLRWIASQGPFIPLIILGMLVSVGGVLLAPLFVWRALRWNAIARSCGAVVVVMIAYHLAFSSFVRFQGERYRVPIVPLLALTLVVGATGVPREAFDQGDVR